MKLVFASDSFKGTLGSGLIAELLCRAAAEVMPTARVIPFCIADGGEGLMGAVSAAHGGSIERVRAHDGLMRLLEAPILDVEGEVFIESAAVCGLSMLPDDLRNPLATTSYGIGECVRGALDLGCRRITVGLGGTCTNDGGMGCLRALGVRFLDIEGVELAGNGADLVRVARIDMSELDARAKAASFTVLCDVANPLLGDGGATYVFGPQKGAGKTELAELERGMAHFASVVADVFPAFDAETPGYGAAGGLGMAFAQFLGASVRSGIEAVLDAVGFDEALSGADLVVTGEGRLDSQSLQGKAVAGVASRARAAGVPVVAICGQVDLDARSLSELGVLRAVEIASGSGLAYDRAHAEERYLRAAEEVFRELVD